MKTYACSNCGNRMEVADKPASCGSCGDIYAIHELDGIVSGGGVKQIWREGQMVWEGTGLEAVELLSKYFQSSCTVDSKRATLAIDTIEGYGKFHPGQDGYAGIMAIRDYIKRTSSVVPNEQAAEADRIVRLLGYARYLPTWSPPEAVDALRAAVVYVAKYYKT